MRGAVLLAALWLAACGGEGAPAPDADPGEDDEVCFGISYRGCRTFEACTPEGYCIEFSQMEPNCGMCANCDCVPQNYCATWEPWDPFDESSPSPSEAGEGCATAD